MRKPIIIMLIALSFWACEKEDQPYGLCDSLSQPESIFIDSVEIYLFDFFTPNSDGYNDVYQLEICETPNSYYYISDIFTDFKFTVYSNSTDDPIFESEDQTVVFEGLDAHGNRIKEGVYRYELLLGGIVYSRFMGVRITPFCLDNLNCTITNLHDESDPIFYGECN